MQTALWTQPVGTITPRAYQAEDVQNSFRLWDQGEVGTLTRCFTGGGKTIMSCLKFKRWLEAGANNRCMVLSYEQELVRQFEQEIRDVLGGEVTTGIEMGSESIDPSNIPQIVVASRQSLMTHDLATAEQREELRAYGLPDIGLLTKSMARRAINALRKDIDVQTIADTIAEFNRDYRCNHELGRVSRLYKFDWRLNWLLVMDEAHKYSMKLKTVGHVVEWFEQNPNHRRSGVTATPKRRDRVSIGTKLFPGIALDFPFTRAVAEGFAVPYVQKFIQVEAIDFRALKEASKGSQEKWDGELNRLLNTERELAKLCDPMLDMVGDRPTLIFNPSVEMGQNVAAYINARSECECASCGTRRWYPNLKIGHGAKCRECNDWIVSENIVKGGTQAHCLHGGIPERARREVYRRHKSNGFQFLSVCGLCREGYNDPGVAAVAVFRPVSKEASSLAEQMKGRGSRPLRGIIEGLLTREERLAAIASSTKPNCLIIDLVGITGLADCASTVQIYADGLPDEIVARAEEIALTGGLDDPQEAIDQAQREEAEEKERQRLAREAAEQQRREAAERRAKLDAEVTYTVHEVGTAPRDRNQPTEKMLKSMHWRGMEFLGWEPSFAQASRMIGQLKNGEPPTEVAHTNRVPSDCWRPSRPSQKQQWKLRNIGYRGSLDMTPNRAHETIDAILNGKTQPDQRSGLAAQLLDEIHRSDTSGWLSDVARKVRDERNAKRLTDSEYHQLVAAGKERRNKVF
jgi:superfamily II DNA or RNA helicase